MLSKAQIMQIGAVTKNPALVARMMKDYKARQPRSRRPPEELLKTRGNYGKHTSYLYREIPGGWFFDWYFNSCHVRTCYYDYDGLLHRADGPALVYRYSGSKVWHWHGDVHREDGPAIESGEYPTLCSGAHYLKRDSMESLIRLSSGSKLWARYGKLHRVGGPAILDNGKEEWWVDGKLHNIIGPAVKFSDGTEKWYRNGKLHRIELPAITYNTSSKEWWYDGLRHRDDGPAIEKADGTKEYYVRGNLVGEKKFEQFMKDEEAHWRQYFYDCLGQTDA